MRHCSRVGEVVAGVGALLWVWSALTAGSAAGSLYAQMRPRDSGPGQVPTGAGVVAGRVIDGATGAPLQRARVRLRAGGTPSRLVVAARDGGFRFENVPAGRFSLFVSKSTYLDTTYPDGGRTIRSTDHAVLAAGQRLEGAVVKMYRGASISGRILDAHGDPVDAASVVVWHHRPGSRPQVGGNVQTNDLGEFRIARLTAGSYILAAVPHNRQWEESAPGPLLPQPVPTYFPSTVSADLAEPIAVERGESIANIDVVLAEGTPVTVTGVVVDRDGQPIPRDAWVHAWMPGRSLKKTFDGGSTVVRPEGTFRLTLHPGEYVLQATVQQSAPGGIGTERVGQTRVTVGGSPEESVTIVVGHGARASGRVVFESAGPPPPAPKAPLHLPLHSGDGTCRSGAARISPDWTFQVEGLHGVCSAPRHLTFGRWRLKAVRNEGTDLLGRSIAFEPERPLDDLQLVFTDRRSELTFGVTDERGQTTTEYVVLVFPTERARWEEEEPIALTFVLPPGERRAAMVVAPGHYFVTAVDDLGWEDARSPAVLDRLVTSAVRATVVEGAIVNVSLRRIRFADVLR